MPTLATNPDDYDNYVIAEVTEMIAAGLSDQAIKAKLSDADPEWLAQLLAEIREVQ